MAGVGCPTVRDYHLREAQAEVPACAQPMVPDAIHHAAALLRAPSVAADNLGEGLAEADLRQAHAAAPRAVLVL